MGWLSEVLIGKVLAWERERPLAYGKQYNNDDKRRSSRSGIRCIDLVI